MTLQAQVLQMQTAELAEQCAEQTQRFFDRKSYDDVFCFELFRRAMVQKSDDAWQHVFAQFRALTAGWVQSHSLFAVCDEDADYFVNEAFFRMARACTPERFPGFDRVAQLLAYLKACVHGALTDYYERVVAPQPDGLLIDEVTQVPVSRSVQSEVMDREDSRRLWEALRARLNGEKEIIVLESFFLLGLKPRDIYAANPRVFADTREVYQVKGNLLRRLRRDEELEQVLRHHD